VAKYSSSGAHLWSKRFGGSWADAGVALRIDGSDNVLLASTFQSLDANFGGVSLSAPSAYAFAVVKLRAADGSTAWAQCHGGTGTDVVQACALAVDRSGDVVVTGNFQSTVDLGGGSKSSIGGMDLFIAKYSGLDGHYLWGKTLGSIGPDNCLGVATDPSTGNIVVTGTASGVDFGSGQAAMGGIFIAAYDASGKYLWAITNGGTSEYGAAVAIDGSGNLVVTGRTVSGIYFGPGSQALPGAGAVCYWVVGFTISGNSAPACRWGKCSTVTAGAGTGVALSATGQVLVSGSYQQQTDVGGTIITTPSNSNGGFVVQYTK